MGDAIRDDHPDNLQATHVVVHFEQRINKDG
jgi:hypothetical protein